MERSNYRISLDIRDSHGACLLDMKQTDNHRRLYITLTDGGASYRITEGCYAVFTAKKPDGTVIYNDCAVENGMVIYDVTPQTTAAQGLMRCEIRLYDAPYPLEEDSNGVYLVSDGDVQLLTSATFRIRVHPTVYNEGDEIAVASRPEAAALTGLVTETIAVKKAAEATAQALTEAKNAGAFDGISAAHVWDGTVLTITSSAGTSSADLKGEKGEQGEKGDKGDRGDKGDKGDPGIVNIDDTAVGPDAWSGKGIIDRLCPAFTQRGSVVQCTPVAGYPLGVVSFLEKSQTGYTGLTLTRCGKNLYDKDTYPFVDGYIYGTSGITTNSPNYGRTGFIPVSHLVGQTITLNRTPGGTNPGMAFYDANKVYISGGKGSALTVPDGAAYMRFSVDAAYADGKAVQIEIGSAATGYEPYQRQTFTVDFGKTVFFGSYSWENGLLIDENDASLYLGTDVSVTARPGINTLYSSVGATYVSGKSDPVAIIEKLNKAILSLGGNI